MKTIVTVCLLAPAIAGFAWAMVVGENRQERADCIGWSVDAETFDQFFLTQWQKDQCDAQGIKINAPVRAIQ